VLAVWLTVTVFATLPDLALSTVMTSVRFTLGWYVARSYALLASCVVLIALLTETTVLYGRLANALLLLRRERADRLMTGFDRKSVVSLYIQDSGPGITAENQDRIFDPFFTTKPTGMGMGLSICRTIIETHGGKLRLTKTSHHGSSFEIALPIVQQTGSRAEGGRSGSGSVIAG
jgi:nitrogen fixation/metabolism regulation signal transduction histidine kinase